MATFNLSQLYSSQNILVLLILFSIIYYSSLLADCTVSGAESYHVVSVQSLIPKGECSSFQEADPSKLKIVNRHGPCSKSTTKLTHEDILHHDQIRTQYLNAKTSTKPKTQNQTSKIPARDGTSVHAGNYIVEIALGTPKTLQTVIFDSGSDQTWVQCQPCTSQCYEQQDQLFDPSKSSTYSNISCTSPYCTSLTPHGCSDSTTCLYQIRYGDNSYTVGFFAQDTLTLGSDTVPNFRFGCGKNNSGRFGKSSGLLGLGRRQSSIVMQTIDKYGGVFAYCLPALSSTAGYLRFGRGRLTSDVRYTPMLARSGRAASFYFLELMSMSVGGQRLNINPAVFSRAGTIIDSGTVITRMPSSAYVELREAFRSQMSGYPMGQEYSILDTCYDLSKYDTVNVPVVEMNFRGAAVRLDTGGVLYVVSGQQVCLGFAANGRDDELMILGNTQQRRFDVVYDVRNRLVGFGAGGC